MSDSRFHLIRVFVSSPGDVPAERAVLDSVVKGINTTDGQHRGFRLEVFRWETNTTPKIGPKPQPVVDAQTPPYDIYLGIMSVRFGTPTDTAGSGTEEEFNAALAKWQTLGEPWIMFYFNDAANLKEVRKQLAQYTKVCEFRERLEKQGLVAGYEGVEGDDSTFRTKVDLHLRRVVHEIFPKPKSQLPPLPETSTPPTAVEHYLQRLAIDTEHLTLLGMGRSLQVELPIDEAYIPLQATAAQSLELKPTERSRDGHDIDLGDVFREAAKRKMRAIVVLGEPGSGKTTAARQVAWQLSGGRSRSTDIGLPTNLVPVMLRFRNLSRAALDSPESLTGLRLFLEQETRCPGAPSGQDQPGEALWNGQAGGLVWILDGLDEVVDPADRQRVAGWLRSAVKERPNDWFFVTCRFQGYFRDGVPLGPKFAEFHVRPLNDQQVEQFVRAWFKAAYGKLLGPGAVASNKAQADSDQLLGILKLSENQLGHIRELCANPLLLTILCIVFHEERKLPTGRAELYAHCVRVLLEYWRRDLYTTDLGTKLKPYDAEAAQSVLARIAWWLHQEEQRTTAPLAELAAEAARGLTSVTPSSGLGHDGLAFVERMRAETGILALGGEGLGKCGFLHLSFQEYLAADHAARENLAPQLAPRATDSWWREVALLSLRRSRPYCETFFQEMLRAGIAESHPDLAERCLQEALYFAADPFVSVLRQPDTPPARVAAVLRLLRERCEQVPELATLCVELARSSNTDIRGFSREILVRLGVTTPFAAGAQPFEVMVDERTGLTLVAIPPGEFLMGSKQGYDEEKPVHHVRLTQRIFLGKYPVTNAQYGRYLDMMQVKARIPACWNDRRFNQPEQPVVGVNWYDAVAYCLWAGGRLPTEAEWEYACRAGSTTEYCFGDDESVLGDYAWYDKKMGGQTSPVGVKKPNAWGLHDMHGNVWEWCGDWIEFYNKLDAVNPTGPMQGSERVVRGGDSTSSAKNCRSAVRDWDSPEYFGRELGFRVAIVPVLGKLITSEQTTASETVIERAEASKRRSHGPQRSRVRASGRSERRGQ
jgi:formylglycine-generating enzyme required for sulfatase activity